LEVILLVYQEENYKKQWVESRTISWHTTDDDKVMSIAMTQQSKRICKMADRNATTSKIEKQHLILT